MRRCIRFVDGLIDRALSLLFILILLIGVYFVYDTAYVYYHASAQRVAYYRPGSKEESTEAVRPLGDDYVAWISMEDTSIDYPVMQGDNNSKYLNTDPYGDYSLAGSIFLDSRNAADFSDSYSLLYGHHMSSGIMFGALDDYYDEQFFEEHRKGTLYAAGVSYDLRAFAVLITDAGVDAIFDPNGSELDLNIAKRDSIIYRDPESNHIVAMSTCKEPGSTARTVVLLSMTESTDQEVTT